MLSCYVGKVSKAKVITKINKINYGGIIDNFDIEEALSAPNILRQHIIKYVRSMQNSMGSAVEAVYRIIDNKVEALEFSVKKDSRVLDVPLSQLKLKKNLLLCNIIRRGKIILPSGQDMIKAGDTVIVVTTHKGLDDIDDILA
ncbi:MAG: TrkA C-terminal domain-containing protein [Eisenbergiella massiliensis]